jgi:hypothetical protein
MTAMTYDGLKADIQTYAERNDSPFIDQIPQFIALAENRLSSEVKPLGFLRVVSGNINSNTLAKPVRWRRTRSFSVVAGNGERKYLFLRSYEYCRTYAPGPAFAGTPRYYADYDYEHFYIAPNPDLVYNFELSYYERPTPLSDAVQTSWTTQYAPQLLLYASLLEAQPFLKTSERIAEFQALYDRALQALMKEDSERTMDASA